MRWFLEKTEEHVQKGLDAHARGDLEDARFHYLKAAEYLFRAAGESEGGLKTRRIALAEELSARGQALGVRLARPSVGAKPPAVGPAAIPIGEDDPARAWLVAERPSVRFDDVAGLEEVKEQIRLKLIYPYTHPELAARFGVKRGGGLLLYGPPGTGKTLIARAVAGEVDAAFFCVQAADIMTKWVGEAEKNVQALFAAARSHERAVIFMDEADALMPKRSTTSSSVVPRVVNQLLTELQGFRDDTTGLLFMGATNEPWALDEAALRPGRFDERIYVPLPDAVARERILWLNLRDSPLEPEIDLRDLAAQVEGYSGADVANICRKACAIPFLEAVSGRPERKVSLADFGSVMRQAPPSVSPKTVARFERFRFA